MALATIDNAKQYQDILVHLAAVSAFNGTALYYDYIIGAMILFAQRKGLEFNESYPNELTDTVVIRLRNNIAEYSKSVNIPEVTFEEVSRDTCGVVITPSPTPTQRGEWSSQTISITSVGQTVFTNINFNINNVDTDSVFLTIDGDDPEYGINNDYHMIGNTLYWHGSYDLRPELSMLIKWRE